MYGDIVTFYVGRRRCMVLNSYDIIREALVDRGLDFAHRGQGWLRTKVNPHQDGIIQADYTDTKRRLRNDSLSILRTLGVGKTVLEEKIAFEAAELVRVIAERHGQAFDPSLSVNVHVLNVIHAVLFDERFDHTDKAINELILITNDLMATGLEIGVLDFFPALRFWPKFGRAMTTYQDCRNAICRFLDVRVDGHVTEHVSGMTHDYVHALMDRRSLGGGADGSSNGDDDGGVAAVGRNDLRLLLQDFVVAGAETTASSLK